MIEFIGPLPPPVHGFAWVNQQVLNGLRKRTSVRVWDRARPRFRSASLRKLVMPLLAFYQLLAFVAHLFRHPPRAIYLACSGGAGMVIDSAFVLAARAFRIPVYVHHHAFSYLNAPSRMARYCLAFMRNGQHIVLCSHMSEMLSYVHAIPSENITALSNAAFLPSACPHPESPKMNGLVVGFLSNITVAKGILDFFELAERFTNSQNSPKFLIAGPVDELISDSFEQRLRNLSNVEHVGPVYGEAKEAFYRRLDLLAFPSRNEAEPVTILEAFRSGVPVVANHRGCIATMVDETSGLVVAEEANFVKQAADLIVRLSEKNSELAILKAGAIRRFAVLQGEHSKKLADMLDRISQGLPLGASR